MLLLSEDVIHLLRTEPLLNNRVGLLGLGGSLAYGTNLPGKGDIDVRGFAFEPAVQLIGGEKNFETFVHKESDTVIYSFTHFLKLLLENNPNTLEILGCKPEHYFFIGPVGQQLIDNVDKFLSKRVFHTFGGYAKMQLERMENAIAHDSLEGRKVTEHIQGSLERAMFSFNERYKNFKHGSIQIRIVPSDDPEEETELVLDIHMDGYPLAQVASMLNEFVNIKRQYSKLSHRNKKKDLEHLDKHAMHIVRILLSGIELMKTGKMKTYMGEHTELLLSIRKGYFRNPDGTYNSAYFDLKKKLDAEFEYGKKHTVLPDYPDFEWVNNFKFEVCKKIITECDLETLQI